MSAPQGERMPSEIDIPVTDPAGTRRETVQYGYWPEGHPNIPRWGRRDKWTILCTVPGALGPFTATRTIRTEPWLSDPIDKDAHR